MLATPVILVVSLAYLGLLFAIAYYGDRRAAAGRSVIASSYVYALSLAVYATSWTFYGSVGRAADTGIGFLPIYLGPTLMFALGLVVLRKIIRISKANRITSIADFVASRYGKSALLGGLVTAIAVVGIVPYISLQLKAISDTFNIVQHHPDLISPAELEPASLFADKAFYVALLLAAFTIAFGTRKLDVSERHEGLVAAIAFESVVKLVAFLCVGLFVTFGIFGGFGDLFERAAAVPGTEQLFSGRRGGDRLRRPAVADGAVDARDPAAAAPVPDRGGRERGRAPPAQGDLAVPALPPGDQPVRAADRPRRARAAAGHGRASRLLRAGAADGRRPGGARAVRLPRRVVGGHRAWSSSRRSRSARWSRTTWSCPRCCGAGRRA